MNRRDFVKGSAGAAALAAGASPLRAFSPTSRPAIPGLADLASVRMTHGFMELFNLPIAMNDWGYAQTVKSVSAISAIAFPPYACCGVPSIPWSPGYLTTCELFVNGRLASISDDPAQAVTYQWFPHRVVREQTVDELFIRAEMFLPADTRATVQSIVVRNMAGTSRDVTLGFDMRAGVIHKGTTWFNELPGEGDNRQTWNAAQGRITFAAQHSPAACAQGIHPPAQEVRGGNMLRYTLRMQPDERREFHFVAAIASNASDAEGLHDRLQENFAVLDRDNESVFDRLVRSAFTPGNSDFSGHLPQLKTDNETLWNLYHNGFKGLLTARRRSPDSAYGPTLLTLSGHVLPTLSFPWDTALTSLSLALLDPQPLRGLVEVWFQRDMHQHLATDYITGDAIGPWYGVNDMAIVRCAQNYLRVTGDFAWLDKTVGERKVIDHLHDHATYWKKLVKTNTGLADYGEISNLLEVVSTYLHEVAGMNAGNVSSMRFVGELLERRGQSQQAKALRVDAQDLAARINRLLYVDGKGWWRCGQPDASFNEVRHCYDFLAVLDNMSEDLTARQKSEMAHFFHEELASKKWMRALSAGDPDATWNIRPDHSCLGAYAAWPPMCAKGLYKCEGREQIAPWLTEVAKAGRQGPIGQGHFTEDVVPPLYGGAHKASEDAPYIEDWCCISAGAFADLVIESIFGVDPTLYGGLRAAPKLADFDAAAQLENLPYQGAEYAASSSGVRRIS
ncbi:MAG TPA: twin-arginine translocation signal domain-containing protein [Acidobacteriaceae bacterium]